MSLKQTEAIVYTIQSACGQGAKFRTQSPSRQRSPCIKWWHTCREVPAPAGVPSAFRPWRRTMASSPEQPYPARSAITTDITVTISSKTRPSWNWLEPLGTRHVLADGCFQGVVGCGQLSSGRVGRMSRCSNTGIGRSRSRACPCLANSIQYQGLCSLRYTSKEIALQQLGALHVALCAAMCTAAHHPIKSCTIATVQPLRTQSPSGAIPSIS